MSSKQLRSTPPTDRILRMTLVLVIATALCRLANAQTPSPAPPPLASGGANYVYASEQPSGYNQPGSLVQFRADATGKVTPTNSLELPAASGVLVFTVDRSGEIYAALPAYFEKSGNSQELRRSAEIAIYDPKASGPATPRRTVSGPLMSDPRGIAVGNGGEIYVADSSDTLYVFSSDADGLSTPARTISGPLTHLDAKSSVRGLAVDSSGFLYVAAGKSILVFSPEADQNTAPVRIISSMYNGCSVSFRQLGLDDQENLYASTENNMATSGPNPCIDVPAVFVFARGVDGDSAPLRALSPTVDKTHPQGNVASFAVDRAGNIFTAGAGGNEILGYGPGADRDALPASQINLQNVPQRSLAVLAVQ